MIRVPRESRLTPMRFVRMGGVEFWEWRPLVAIPPNPDDIFLTLDRPTRLDLLSTRYYGTPQFGWVIARANGMELPIADYDSVRTLRIPSERFVREELPRLLRRDP